MMATSTTTSPSKDGDLDKILAFSRWERGVLAKNLTNVSFERHRFKALIKEALKSGISPEWESRAKIALEEAPVYEV